MKTPAKSAAASTAAAQPVPAAQPAATPVPEPVVVQADPNATQAEAAVENTREPAEAAEVVAAQPVTPPTAPAPVAHTPHAVTMAPAVAAPAVAVAAPAEKLLRVKFLRQHEVYLPGEDGSGGMRTFRTHEVANVGVDLAQTLQVRQIAMVIG